MLALVTWLERMRFMLRVEIADVSDEWPTLRELCRRAAGRGPVWLDPCPEPIEITLSEIYEGLE